MAWRPAQSLCRGRGGRVVFPEIPCDPAGSWPDEEDFEGLCRGRARRFGPSDLHLDEGALRAPNHVLDLWPERPLKNLSDSALRALTCKLVGRPLSREEWSFAMGDADYRPLCPPLPER